MTPMKKNGQIDTDFNINLINDENELKNKYEVPLPNICLRLFRTSLCYN